MFIFEETHLQKIQGAKIRLFLLLNVGFSFFPTTFKLKAVPPKHPQPKTNTQPYPEPKPQSQPYPRHPSRQSSLQLLCRPSNNVQLHQSNLVRGFLFLLLIFKQGLHLQKRINYVKGKGHKRTKDPRDKDMLVLLETSEPDKDTFNYRDQVMRAFVHRANIIPLLPQ